jgi:serine/threonine protein phosphatase PrpC
MVDPKDADSHVNANVITRAVGVAEELKVDTAAGDVRAGDLFLLATDGLTRVISDPELAEVLTSQPPESAVDSLIEMVLSRGAPDNVSIIVVRVT